MRRLLDVPAPAKLNLFLHITGQRDDGYHLLQSVFMLIDWCDRLHFELRPNGHISREDLTPMPLPADDLSVRAARALQDATGCAHGGHIGLEKHLPAEAGMGGGSSDAATTLIALNRLWGLGLNRQQLATIGLKLGADVPFFIGGHHAWVEGVGEQLTPVKLPKARFVVVKPHGGASTQRIFSSPSLKRDTKTATIQGFAANDSQEASQAIGVVDIQKILDFGHNDLQPVAQALCPDVGRCIQWLQDQGLQGRMTGSGTAVFAHMPQAMQLTTAPSDWTVRECSNMDVHPLLDWCSD
ncbi:MAG: 4-(cytidine 5'-diphospho)-2-C-methyl-D-erythritol kinase [Burkholderiales bacterium]|nr:MAG: 4-(cytidine 5'-diphospho)-2-C-methyl-D-erythritol kinase [Burkholderiales bacterium]